MPTKKKTPAKKKAPPVAAETACSPPPTVTHIYSPPMEDQLIAKVEALADIAELAEQIRDPEVFQRHALKIAKRAAVMSQQWTITFPEENDKIHL